MRTIYHQYENKTPQGPSHPNERYYYEEEYIPETFEEKLDCLMEQINYLHEKVIKQEKDSMYRPGDVYQGW